MNNSTIEILEGIMAEAKADNQAPLLWKLNKQHIQDVARHLAINNIKNDSGELFSIPIDPTYNDSCLICENKIYYVL